jgi:hypothetical protein
MVKRVLLVVPVFLLSVLAYAQRPAPTPVCAQELVGKMVCILPSVYGPTGLVLPNDQHDAHFVNSFQADFAPLTRAIGSVVSLQNFPSPASGVVFALDRSLGVVSRSSESYGPIFAERAETIGRHRLYVAGTYQFYDFSTLDNFDLDNLPATFSHVRFPINGVFPPWEQDFIVTTNRVDLKVHQFTLYGTFGLTDRIDISAAVPILDVRLGITSSAQIVRIAPPNVNDPSADPATGQFHYFQQSDPVNSTNQTFPKSQSTSGIGDVTFRVKGTVMKRERARLALGLDLRTPTGDSENFLGAGAPGVKPFLAASYGGRVSPHANLAFQWNGKSILAGNVATGGEGKLPNQFFYSFGVDAGVTRKLTLAVDYLGQRLSSTVRTRETTFTDPFGTAYPNIRQIELTQGSYTMSDLSLGAKVSPFGNLLVTGNVVLRLNKAGLRATAVPMIGISYTF